MAPRIEEENSCEDRDDNQNADFRRAADAAMEA